MAETFTQCPKCGHVLPQAMPASARCPACGLYFFKWGQTPRARRERDDATEEPGGTLLANLLAPKPELDVLSFYGRCVILGLLALWTWPLIDCDYRDGEIFESFMHGILLPIHEAGHIFLIPFGEFMTVLGGSLLQLALPLGIAVAFVVRNRDNFAAALCLWWCATSLLDLSPYIYDALHPRLTLLGGHTGEEGPHDWVYLLDALGQLSHAQGWGRTAHGLGALLAMAALLWAALVLLRQRRALQDS